MLATVISNVTREVSPPRAAVRLGGARGAACVHHPSDASIFAGGLQLCQGAQGLSASRRRACEGRV